MPENSAVATKARRQALSAAASSELAGGCRNGPRLWLMERAYHRNGRNLPSALANVRRPLTYAGTCGSPDQIRNSIPLVSRGYIYIRAGSRPLVNFPDPIYPSSVARPAQRDPPSPAVMPTYSVTIAGNVTADGASEAPYRLAAKQKSAQRQSDPRN